MQPYKFGGEQIADFDRAPPRANFANDVLVVPLQRVDADAFDRRGFAQANVLFERERIKWRTSVMTDRREGRA
jgi:hypothetical protein